MNWFVLKDHPKVKYLFADNFDDDPDAFSSAFIDIGKCLKQHDQAHWRLDRTFLTHLHTWMAAGNVCRIAEEECGSFIDLFFATYPDLVYTTVPDSNPIPYCNLATEFRNVCSEAAVRAEQLKTSQFGGHFDQSELRRHAGAMLADAWERADRRVPRVTPEPEWWVRAE